jgi:hypothetical protein
MAIGCATGMSQIIVVSDADRFLDSHPVPSYNANQSGGVSVVVETPKGCRNPVP